jgi:hypothetical protein
MAKSPKDLTIEEFFEGWEKSNSIEEAMKALGATKVQEIALRAAFFRKQGIPLKEFPKKAPAKKEFDREKALAAFAKVTGQSIAKVKKEGDKVKKEKEEAKKKTETSSTPS